MYLVAAHVHGDACGVEALVLHAAQDVAVDGVAVRGAEGLDVEQAAAVADFLVGGEAHRDARVADRGVLDGAGQVAHDLGHAGLVVGAEQGGAVGAHDVAALEPGQARRVLLVERDLDAVVHAQDKLAALVVPDARLHAHGGGVGACVDVRDESQARKLLAASACGQVGGDVGVLVDVRVGKPQLKQLGA